MLAYDLPCDVNITWNMGKESWRPAGWKNNVLKHNRDINWLLQVSHRTWVAEIHGKKSSCATPARSAVGPELLQVAGQEPGKRRGPSEKLVGQLGTITLGLQVSVDPSTVSILQNMQAISLEEESLMENQKA